ncbi:MAG: peptidoglycan editing factor PgeF [Microcoleaceae cyanobacterium]
MHTWHWHYWQDLPVLKCSLLDSWSHGFFTRHFSPRMPADLVEVLQPEATAYRVKQVHGNRVLTTTLLQQSDPTQLQQADGLLTTSPSQAVWVASADCVPVLIADTITRQVAAVHAGWRGTAAKIVPEAVAQFQAQGSQLKDLRIVMGPAISGPVYQVATEVAIQLSQTFNPTDSLTQLIQQPHSPLMADTEPGKIRVDVRRVNSLQLEQLGITPEQVAVAPQCTYQEPDLFFSYRRDHQKKVQWSGIVSGE